MNENQRNKNVHPLLRGIINSTAVVPPGGCHLPPIYVPACIQPQAMSLAQRMRMAEDARLDLVAQEVFGDRRPMGRPSDEDDEIAGETADERYDAAREHEYFRED